MDNVFVYIDIIFKFSVEETSRVMTPIVSQTHPTVTIIQRRLTHYRVPLFDKMRDRLDQKNITLRVLVGAARPDELTKLDAGEMDWAEKMPTRYFKFGHLCWKPVRRLSAGSDLTIVTQENSLLANHSLLLRRPRGKLAFWGHGANLQSSNPDSLSERYKRWTTRRVDWWFAYTRMSVDLVAKAGFNRDRITCLNNAVDTRALAAACRDVSSAETKKLRADLDLPPKSVTAVYIGSLYKHKRLDFLIKAGEKIRAIFPEFHLIVIGAGPEGDFLGEMAKTRNWLHPVGMKNGKEKAQYMSLGQVLLNPGLVGLNILDAFACGLPMITSDCGMHSPEVSYLKDENGIMTENSVDDYAKACIALFKEPDRLLRLQLGAVAAASVYSIDTMAERFVRGISTALAK